MFLYTQGSHMIEASHHIEVATMLDEVMFSSKYNNNLQISIAPRSGKTMMCAVYLLPYMMALSNGKANVLLACYSTKLGKQSLREARMIMETPLYLKLFPNSRVSRFVDGKIEMSSGGSANPVSPQSSLTGLGAGVQKDGYGAYGAIIVDDLVNSADSFSKAMREGANDWFINSLSSRKNNPKTPIIVIAQRLHQQDLIGYIHENESDKYNKLIIPTIDEENKTSFWEDKYPYEQMMELKEINPFLYHTQYQQAPISKGAGIIQEKWIHTYNFEDLPEYTHSQLFITADTAMKTGQEHDYTVFGVWMEHGVGDSKIIFLLDIIRGKWEADGLFDRAVRLKEQYQVPRICIEDKASGIGLIQMLNGRYSVNEVVAIKRGAKENKTQRLHDASFFMAKERVFFPQEHELFDDIKDELLSFSELMLHSNDDICDMISDGIRVAFIDEDEDMGVWEQWKDNLPQISSDS